MRTNLKRTLAVVAGFSLAVAVGIAGAKINTLQDAKNAKVTNQSGTTVHKAIVVNSKAFAVYTLSGDSASHPKCTSSSGCFAVWPPVKVANARDLSKGPGVNGRLGTWRRNGFIQVTLNGHPLYTFHPDSHKNWATGEGIHSFGGTWHVVGGAGGSSGGSGGMTTSGGTTSTMTGTTSCLYPPCY